ncbi:MAG: hypothetical protein IT210_12155 [Armatimonadetes bacterium]|nr:hypothetical protein [Armatimonadota bacterium]
MTVNPAQLDNESLVMSALVGNMAAYDELVRRFRGAVIATARQIVGCHDTAEDVAQEVFLLAFKALPQLGTPAKFPGWLYAITRNRARRIAARNARSRTRSTA